MMQQSFYLGCRTSAAETSVVKLLWQEFPENALARPLELIRQSIILFAIDLFVHLF